MTRNLVSATVSAAFCLMTVTPGVAAAQEHRFAGFDGPRGVTATVNLRVPLGRDRARRASYGLTFSYARTNVPPGFEGLVASRAFNVADFRFSGTEMRQARIAGLDLANLDRTRRMNLNGGNSTLWIIGGIAVVVGGCLLLECHDEIFGDDSEDTDSTTP